MKIEKDFYKEENNLNIFIDLLKRLKKFIEKYFMILFET